MLKRLLPSALLAALLAVAGIAGAAAQSANGVIHANGGYHKRVCTTLPETDNARCHAEVATDQSGRPLVARLAPRNATTLGAVPYYARDLWSAYYGTTAMPPAPAGSIPTVAVVDAYGYSRAATDLASYRKMNGLPPLCSLTVTTGCVRFTKLNQSGVAGSYPIGNIGWAQEQALDIQMVSALCPWCNIVLVEASSASYGNIAAAEVTAGKRAGVIAISNSFGGPESGTSLYAASFSPIGTTTNGYNGKLPATIAVTASSGDNGYAGGAEFPSSAPYVLSTGGTSLVLGSGGWSQSAWTSGGSGCSTVYGQMSWQTPALPATNACAGRAAADVSAVADPNTGVAVVYGGLVYRFGGTSVSAPIIAGIIGQRNQPITFYAANLYANSGALRDVTTGSNGSCGSYLCTAGLGYDGPTGLGTPNGIGNLSPF